MNQLDSRIFDEDAEEIEIVQENESTSSSSDGGSGSGSDGSHCLGLYDGNNEDLTGTQNYIS